MKHHVTIELVNYEAAIASPTEPKKMAAWLVKESPLKFDCDCGRHTFWYRYIATIGGFNAGRPENGYPKIRNPKLAGVACKHVLRVMHELARNMAIRSIVASMILRDQSATAKKSAIISQEQAANIMQMQTMRKRTIQTKELAKDVAKLRHALALKQAPRKVDVEQEKFNVERNLRKLLQTGGLSQKDFSTIMSTLR